MAVIMHDCTGCNIKNWFEREDYSDSRAIRPVFAINYFIDVLQESS
jgi:hypothetical protein